MSSYITHITNADNNFKAAFTQIEKVKSKLNQNWYLSVFSVILALGALATLGYFGGAPCAAGQACLSNFSFQLSLSVAFSLTSMAAVFLVRRELLKCDQDDANRSLRLALSQKDQVKEILSGRDSTLDDEKICLIIKHLDHSTYGEFLKEAKDNKQLAFNLSRNIPMLIEYLSTADPANIKACCKQHVWIEPIINRISQSQIVENCPQRSKNILKENLKVVQSFTGDNHSYFNTISVMISKLDGQSFDNEF